MICDIVPPEERSPASSQRPDKPAPGDSSSERRLFEHARRGSRSAIDTLFERYRSWLRRWARGRLPPWVRGDIDTSDLVQDALQHTFARLSFFESKHAGALRTYLQHAVENRIRDRLRRATRRLDAILPEADLVPVDDLLGPHGFGILALSPFLSCGIDHRLPKLLVDQAIQIWHAMGSRPHWGEDLPALGSLCGTGLFALARVEELPAFPSLTPERGVEASDVIGSCERRRPVGEFQFSHHQVDEARAHIVSSLPLHEADVRTMAGFHYLVEHIIFARGNG